MINKRFALLLVIALAVLYSLVAAVMLAAGEHPPRPLSPLTPNISPTLFFGFTVDAYREQGTVTPPAAAPLFAIHGAIETQFAATVIALTPQDAKLR